MLNLQKLNSNIMCCLGTLLVKAEEKSYHVNFTVVFPIQKCLEAKMLENVLENARPGLCSVDRHQWLESQTLT